MKKSVLIAIAALLALCGAGVSAHHSAQQFDFTKTASMSGVVKRFQPFERLRLAPFAEKHVDLGTALPPDNRRCVLDVPSCTNLADVRAHGATWAKIPHPKLDVTKTGQVSANNPFLFSDGFVRNARNPSREFP